MPERTRTESDYTGAFDADADPFAAGFVEEWDLAVAELREVLATLERTDLHDQQDLANAEEAIEHGLPEVQHQLHDALDTVRREREREQGARDD